MARYEKTCCFCHKRITAQFWVCKNCEKKYGLAHASGKQKKPTEWPDWAREVYNLAQKERYDVVVRGEGTAYEHDDERGDIANADQIDEFAEPD